MYIYIYISATMPPGTGGVILMFWQLLALAIGFWCLVLVSGSLLGTHTIHFRRSWRFRMTFSASFRHHFLLKIRKDFLHAFGADLGPKLETNAFQNTWKNNLRNHFGKSTQNLGSKCRKDKAQDTKNNIAKPTEGCSKSHFLLLAEKLWK